MTATLLLAQACNHRWSNHRLLTACAGLSSDTLQSPQPAAFFGSLWALLCHLLDVDLFYLDALHDQPRPYRDHPWPDLATLSEAQAASDRRLIALCRGLAPEQLTQLITLPRATGPVREQRLRTLQHLFVHQLHHRGQAHALLLASGVAPPQLDEFFLAQDEPLRRAELALLGIAERELWGIAP